MHRTHPSHWRHSHDYAGDFSGAERRTRIVVGITAAMMVAEIAAGIAFNSMALLADGWHMSTHVAAFLITVMAYHFSRRHAADPRYSFGTGKMSVLGGFASAVVLCVVAILMAGESVHRLIEPVPIRFDQATAALLAGKFAGWSWLDAVMGIVGSAVVAAWAYGLIRDTSGILLDRTPESSELPDEIRGAVESDGDSLLTDLHIWQVAAGRFAAIVGIVAHGPKPADAYRELLREHEELVHVTVEAQACSDSEPARAGA